MWFKISKGSILQNDDNIVFLRIVCYFPGFSVLASTFRLGNRQVLNYDFHPVSCAAVDFDTAS